MKTTSILSLVFVTVICGLSVTGCGSPKGEIVMLLCEEELKEGIMPKLAISIANAERQSKDCDERWFQLTAEITQRIQFGTIVPTKTKMLFGVDAGSTAYIVPLGDDISLVLYYRTSDLVPAGEHHYRSVMVFPNGEHHETTFRGDFLDPFCTTGGIKALIDDIQDVIAANEGGSK